MTSTSKKKKKRKSFGFISVPQVHEFDTDSPAQYRLPSTAKKPIEKMNSQELTFNVGVVGAEAESRAEQEAVLHAQFVNEFLNKLGRMGITSPTVDHDELKLRVDFLKKLERQAHLQYATGENLTRLSVAELTQQLTDNHRELVTTTRRETLQDRLAAALLKESNNFRVGCGYDHGLRFMTIEERLEDMSYKELSVELKELGCKKVPRKKVEREQLLAGMMESQCEAALQHHFDQVLVNELDIRDLPTDREGLVAYMTGLLEERKAELERLTIDPDDSEEDDDLVSSPSAKRRRVDPDAMANGAAKQQGNPIVSLKHLPSAAFLKKSTLQQIQYEALYACVCMRAIEEDPQQELSRRGSCAIL